MNNESHLPRCDKNTSRRPALSLLGTVVLGEWLTGESAPEVSGSGEHSREVRVRRITVQYVMLYIDLQVNQIFILVACGSFLKTLWCRNKSLSSLSTEAATA